MKRLIVLCLLLLSCGGIECSPNPYDHLQAPARVIELKVTVNKYNSYDCREKGGLWISGDTKEWINAFSGCVLPEDAPQETK